MSQSPPSLLTGVCLGKDAATMFDSSGKYIEVSNCVWSIKTVTTDDAQGVWCIKAGDEDAQAVAGQWTEAQPGWQPTDVSGTLSYLSVASIAFDSTTGATNKFNDRTGIGSAWAFYKNLSSRPLGYRYWLDAGASPMTPRPCDDDRVPTYIAFNKSRNNVWAAYNQGGSSKAAMWDDQQQKWIVQATANDWVISALGFDSAGTMWCVGKNNGIQSDRVGRWDGNTWVNEGALGGWCVDGGSRACHPVTVNNLNPSAAAGILVFNQDTVNAVHVSPDEQREKWSFLDFHAKKKSKLGSIELSDVEEHYSFSFYLDKSSDWSFCSAIVYGIVVGSDGTKQEVDRKELSESSHWVIDFEGGENEASSVPGSAHVYIETSVFESGKRLLLTVRNPNNRGEVGGRTERVGVLLKAKKGASGPEVTSEDPQVVIPPRPVTGSS